MIPVLMSTQPQPDPISVNVASFLRNHALLKQRSGSLQGQQVDFFRFKRAQRALLSDEYKKMSSNPKNKLPLVKSSEDAKNVFVLLLKNRLLLPAQKLHTAEAKEQNLKPKKGSPCFLPMQQASFEDDTYYIWFYKKTSPWSLVMGVGILICVFAVMLFPLWPKFMHRGAYYLSMAALGLVISIIVIAVVRFILYVLTLPILPHALWIFPNLFEDVGFFESFKPLYGWDVPKGKKKSANLKSGNAASETAEESTATSASTTGSEKPVAKRRAVLSEVEE